MAAPFAPKKPTFGPDHEDKGAGYDDKKSASTEQLARIPTASQEGIDYLRSKHKKAEDRDDLAEAEASGATNEIGIGAGEAGLIDRIKSKEKQANDTMLGRGFRKEGRTSIRGRLSKFTKKRVATIAVTAVIGGGGIFGFSIVQGPLQLMHLGEILKRPMSNQENTSEKRLGALFRYARSGEFGETRVSYWGSRSVKKINAKLATVGVEVESKTAAGRPESIKYDVSKFEPGAETEKAALRWADENNIPHDYIQIDSKTSTRNGTWRVRNPTGGAIPDHISRAAQGGVIERVYGKGVLGKSNVALKSRTTFRYNGNYSKLHVIKKGQTQLIEKAAEWDKARKAAKEEKIKERQSKFGDFKAKLKPAEGMVSSAAGIVGGAQLGICLARDISKEVPIVNEANLVMPAKNQALEDISVASQIQSGDDFSLGQLGKLVNDLKDKDGKTVWQSKPMNALATNGSGVGTDLDPDVKNGFSSESPEATVGSFLDSIGGKTLCSTGGIIAGTGLGILAFALAVPSGGATATAYTAIAAGSAAATTAAVAGITSLTVKLLSDKPLTQDLSGPFGGGVRAFGSRALANNTFIKAGGAEIPNSNTSVVDAEIQQREDQEFRSRNFFARTFDVSDYRSLASQAIDRSDLDPSDGMSNVATSLLNTPNHILGLFKALIPHTSAADKPYDWGFPRYGFTNEDLKNPAVENPYESAAEATKLFQTKPDYIERAKKCFGVEIEKIDGKWGVSVVKNPEGDPEKDVLPNTSEYISSNCAEGSTDWLRVRLFIFDTRAMEAYACYENDQEACQGMGLGDQGSSDSTSGQGIVSNGDLEKNKDKFTDGTIYKLPTGYVGPPEIGFYNQCKDSRWANKEYPYSSGGSNTICASACGPSSLAMVISTLSNTIINPYEAAQKVKQYHVSGGTDMNGAISFVKDYGLKSKTLSGSKDIKDVLKNGGFVIMSANAASPFTQAGHFIVIRAISEDGTKFYVADPADDNGNGQNRSEKPWPVSSIDSWTSTGLWGVYK